MGKGMYWMHTFRSQLYTQFKRHRLYEKTPDPSKGMAITQEIAKKYLQEAKGNKELARMNAIRDGYNPTKIDHTHRADKQR